MAAKRTTNLNTPGKALRVSSKVNGFRRAGRAFFREAVEIPAGELTAAERAAIEAEPMLVCSVIPVQSQSD